VDWKRNDSKLEEINDLDLREEELDHPGFFRK
jgi:hypothetical protein